MAMSGLWIGPSLGISSPYTGNGTRAIPVIIQSGWILTFFPAQGTATSSNSPTGTLNLTGDATNNAFADMNVTGFVPGATYTLNYNVTAGSTGALALGTVQGDGTIFNYITTGTGVQKKAFIASQASLWIRFGNQAVTPFTVTNIF